MKYIVHILLSFILFAVVSLSFGVNGLNPSDPMEYLIPVFNSEKIFPYLDRILLGVGLKAVSKFITDPVTLSYIFPICVYAIIHIFACLNIIKITKDVRTIYIFTICIICSPFNVATFTYIYPSTFMLLFLTLGAYIYKKSGREFSIGVLIPLLVFSKIQGASFIVNVLTNRALEWKKLIIGVIVGGVIIYGITSLIFYDINYLGKVISLYFEEYAVGQARGYGGVLPPFSMYFTEPYVLFISLLVLRFWKELDKHEKNIFFIGLAQFCFLLFIYLISRRGGELIPNYSAPAIYLITLSVCSKIPTRYFNIKYTAYILVCIVLGYSYAEWRGGNQYFASRNYIFEFIFSAVLVTLYLRELDTRKTKRWITAGLLIIPIFSYKAQSEALSRVNWSRPFTEIYSVARALNDKTYYQFDKNGSYLHRFKMIANLDNETIFQHCEPDCRAAVNYLTDNFALAFKHFENSSIPFEKFCVKIGPRDAIPCENSALGPMSSDIKFNNWPNSGYIEFKNNQINSLYRLSYHILTEEAVPTVLYGVLSVGENLRLKLPVDATKVEFSYYETKRIYQTRDLILLVDE